MASETEIGAIAKEMEGFAIGTPEIIGRTGLSHILTRLRRRFSTPLCEEKATGSAGDGMGMRQVVDPSAASEAPYVHSPYVHSQKVAFLIFDSRLGGADGFGCGVNGTTDGSGNGTGEHGWEWEWEKEKNAARAVGRTMEE